MSEESRNKEYLESVDGNTHLSAVRIIGELEAENKKLQIDRDEYKGMVSDIISCFPKNDLKVMLKKLKGGVG